MPEEPDSSSKLSNNGMIPEVISSPDSTPLSSTRATKKGGGGDEIDDGTASMNSLEIIEEEMNLEELMKQKELLQQRLQEMSSTPVTDDKDFDILSHELSQLERKEQAKKENKKSEDKRREGREIRRKDKELKNRDEDRIKVREQIDVRRKERDDKIDKDTERRKIRGEDRKLQDGDIKRQNNFEKSQGGQRHRSPMGGRNSVQRSRGNSPIMLNRPMGR